MPGGLIKGLSQARIGALYCAAALIPLLSFQAHANDDLDLLLQAAHEAQEDVSKQLVKSEKPQLGLSVSVDGEQIIGESRLADQIHATDKALEAVDIQIKFDGLDTTRRLNLATVDGNVSYKPGSVIDFNGTWNYPDWIDRAEIRLYKQIDKYSAEAIAPTLEVIELPIDGENIGQASWESYTASELTDEESGNLVYALRVYDHKGNYDETFPTRLTLTSTELDNNEDLPDSFNSLGQGDDRTGVSNIPIYGGAVTVHGRNVPPGYSVRVQDQIIPLDDGQKFVASRILPPGDHIVDVAIIGETTKDSGLHFERDIYVPDQEWFYIGLADITVGKRLDDSSESLDQVVPGEFDDTYERGRFAFYVKGKIKGETLITAAFDTHEQDLDEIFDNLDEKDPRRLLRNLDPDDFYPVYGDDSTTVEDAPTSGKFYVRLERGKSQVVWGNFKTNIQGTELTRFERALYGAHARLESDAITSYGESSVKVEAFAAEPGSLPQRDTFRGTGGSAYFLQRQDVNQGSEQIYVEERDRITGEIIARTLLRPDADYEIDYTQGVVLLRRPIQSSTGTSSSVRQTAIGGNEQFLVVVYEFTPTLTELDGFSYGGRAEAWLSDNVRIAASGFSENTGLADQELYGADVLLRFSEKSYAEFEWAESRGNTFSAVDSTDGGFIFSSQSGVNATGGRSQAIRGKVALDLGEITNGAVQGTVGGYYEDREAGFNAPGRFTSIGERLSGAFIEAEINEATKIRAAYDQISREDNTDQIEASAEIEARLNEEYTLSVGVTHSDLDTPLGSTTGAGERVDVGARLTRELANGDKAWIFGQGTVQNSGTREDNNRVGAGFEAALTDKITASAEASYGTGGIGGLASLNYAPNATDKYYLGYRLDPDTTSGDLNGYDPFGRDYGSIVYGANRAVNEQVDVYFEENYDFLGTQRSLTHTYGVNYTPQEALSLSAGFEAGEVFDEINGDFDRIAISASASLREDVRTASLRFEARFENGVNDPTRDRTTYLASGQFGYNHNDDWRFLANFDAVLSESDQSVLLDGDYIEGSIGWAYRPKDDDRLNALFRYTYLEDLPGSQQVNSQNEILGPRQRSHVLEADFIYDINERLSVGGKYGFRIGQTSLNRASDTFVDSSAHLAVARADFHIVHKWDLLAEARILWLPEIDQTNVGYLAGIYRHLGKNIKVGVGYNFGQFSDDVTDLTLDDEGVFINLIGKF